MKKEGSKCSSSQAKLWKTINKNPLKPLPQWSFLRNIICIHLLLFCELSMILLTFSIFQYTYSCINYCFWNMLKCIIKSYHHMPIKNNYFYLWKMSISLRADYYTFTFTLWCLSLACYLVLWCIVAWFGYKSVEAVWMFGCGKLFKGFSKKII